MNHNDHINLIQKGVTLQIEKSVAPADLIWADFGSGGGAFTLALADILDPSTKIYSIDKDRRALKQQGKVMAEKFPSTRVFYRPGDFRKVLDLPPLDGILMANSLHFVRRKAPVLQRIQSYLKPGGKFIIVEYNTDRGNTWVPHPFSYPTWEKMAAQVGFAHTQKIGAYPSRFLGEIYAAISL